MLVGEVYLLRTGLVTESPMLSAGRPVRSSVIATKLRQVSRAQRPTRALSSRLGFQPAFSNSAGEGVPPKAGVVVPIRAAAPAAPPAAKRVRRLMLAVILSPEGLFESCDGDALGDVALEGEEHHQHRQDNHDRRGQPPPQGLRALVA